MMLPRILIVLATVVLGCGSPHPAPLPEFAGLVDTLSEPGGFFDTDNLVSNETAYLHVLGGLRRLGVNGGVYLGVGPEQNFSYIAEIEPELALIIDIRRDNLLLHLLFKAIFESADTRIEYLCRLYGRPRPPTPGAWRGRELDSLLAYLDRTPFNAEEHEAAHQALMVRIHAYGVPLSPQDTLTIRRFHDEFARAGLDLAFSTLGRPAQRDYPTARRLYRETDLEGTRSSYLASEERWRRVRDLQRQHRIIPVVGDMGGTGAMRSIAAFLKRANRKVAAFYVSNVEFYLMREGTFPTFVETVRMLPAEGSAVLIRSWFHRGFGNPDLHPGHFSSQHLQTFKRFLAMTDQPVSFIDLVADTVGVEPTAVNR